MKKLLLIFILSFCFTVIPIFIFWAHHNFVSGLNPILSLIFIIIGLVILIPILITIFRWLFNFLKNKLILTPDILFLIGLFSFLIADLIISIFHGNSTLDFHFHDTYYVIAHAHVMIALAILFGFFSAVYYYFPKIFKRPLNQPLGYIHFWITFIACYYIFCPMHYEGLAGMPRRYIDYGEGSLLNQFNNINIIIYKTSIIILAAQLLLIFNLLYSCFKWKEIRK